MIFVRSNEKINFFYKNTYFYKIVNVTPEQLKDWIYLYMKPREVYPGQIYYDVEEVEV